MCHPLALDQKMLTKNVDIKKERNQSAVSTVNRTSLRGWDSAIVRQSKGLKFGQ